VAGGGVDWLYAGSTTTAQPKTQLHSYSLREIRTRELSIRTVHGRSTGISMNEDVIMASVMEDMTNIPARFRSGSAPVYSLYVLLTKRTSHNRHYTRGLQPGVREIRVSDGECKIEKYTLFRDKNLFNLF
jgi:hypothetical protein